MSTQQATSAHSTYADPRSAGRCEPRGGCSGRGHFGGRRHAGFHSGPPWARFRGPWQSVPVNIETTDTSFVLTLFAAGLVKENISLAVQNDVLTIAYKGAAAEADPTAPEARFTRREFHNESFERAFQLNGKVIVEEIKARYADGILTVTLPKNPATNQPPQAIAVA
jgi:HSP20 family protein